MSSIKNYIDETSLAAYAAGQLSVGQSLMTAAHIDMCPELESEVARLEALGGQLLEELKPSNDIGYAMLGNILNRIEEQEENFPDHSYSEVSVIRDESKDLFPQTIRRFLGFNYSQTRWRFAGPRSMISHLWQDGMGGRMWMFKSRAGTVTPIHKHSGIEWTLILKGGYSTKEGHFLPGDLHQVDENDEHQPIMDENEDCVCLVFTEGPTIYSSFLPKIMQKFTKI